MDYMPRSYYYANSDVPLNLIGVRSRGQLEAIEAPAVAKRMRDLSLEGYTGDLSPAHLSDIHKSLYGDIYPWAGEFRDFDLIDPGRQVLKHDRIMRGLGIVSNRMSDGHLMDGGRAGLVDTLATGLYDLDRVSPFPQGNREASLVYMSDVADSVEYRLSWQDMEPAALDKAYDNARAGDMSAMRLLVDRNLHLNVQREHELEHDFVPESEQPSLLSAIATDTDYIRPARPATPGPRRPLPDFVAPDAPDDDGFELC